MDAQPTEPPRRPQNTILNATSEVDALILILYIVRSASTVVIEIQYLTKEDRKLKSLFSLFVCFLEVKLY